MKIILAAINAKYIHSNLAVYCLKAYAKPYKDLIQIKEYTINNQPEDILGGLYEEKPDILAFSCYIWNIEMVRQIAKELKKVLPDTKFLAGGPEVSFDAREFLQENECFDGVMIGEGEQTFFELMEHYVERKGSLSTIKGIAYRNEEEILFTTPRETMDLSQVPFPYEEMEDFANKIIYYETSRGCPYSCSYCLSSVDRKVRLRDRGQVERELQFFLDQKVPQVKFVDRTFNCNPEHTMFIWKYLKEHDNGITNFHFEISADILREPELALLKTLRPGLVQLEIGVQTTNPKTIEAIHRKMNLDKLKAAVARVHEGHNVHQHLDLIIGLPYEDYVTFRRSFNEVYAMEPDQLQVGFLKVLKGSYMASCCEEYHILYRDTAPYEVLATAWLSFDEVLQLKIVEEMVEVYYNSGQFKYSVRYLKHFFTDAFSLYEELAQFYKKKDLLGRNHSRIQRFQYLLEFFRSVIMPSKEQEDIFREILTFDCYLREKMKARPEFAGQEEESYKDMLEMIVTMAEANKDNALPWLLESAGNIRKILRSYQIEKFSIDIEATAESGEPVHSERIIFFDYEKRNPLNYDATTYVLMQ